MSRYIITGNLEITQNVTSTTAWLREYGPVLQSLDPEMSLTVAGKNPSKAIMAEADRLGATVVASPPDMSVLLREADVYICPSDNGSGIKLRIMDGLKMGLPIVAHILSSRGYEYCVGKNMFVYNDRESFIGAVKSALSLTGDRQALIAEYQRVFSFASGVVRMRSILQGL